MYINFIIVIILDEMQTRHAGVRAAIMKAHNADYLESIGDYNSALECYKNAVELLIPLIEGIYVPLYVYT